MRDPELRADGALADRHPLVVERALAGHVAHEADILPLSPRPRVVHQIGILVLGLHRVLEGALRAGDLAHTDHVGLAEQDENLDRLGHVGGFAIVLRNGCFLARDGAEGRQGKRGDAEG